MRVIKGIAKGRKLKALKGLNIRPTSDKVKESVFNIINDKINNAIFLDLCAGTGAVGIEALSRGALRAIFAEKNFAAVKLIRENLILCNLEKDSEVIKVDAKKFLEDTGEIFDIVFIDPPYLSGLLLDILRIFNIREIISPKGLLVVEHHSKTVLPEEIGGMILSKKYRYGDTTISLYKRKDR